MSLINDLFGSSKKRKTTRKPTKAQMKKYVYPMLKKATKTAYKKGKMSNRRRY